MSSKTPPATAPSKTWFPVDPEHVKAIELILGMSPGTWVKSIRPVKFEVVVASGVSSAHLESTHYLEIS